MRLLWELNVIMYVMCLVCVLIYIKSTMCINIIVLEVKTCSRSHILRCRRGVSDFSPSCLLKGKQWWWSVPPVYGRVSSPWEATSRGAKDQSSSRFWKMDWHGRANKALWAGDTDGSFRRYSVSIKWDPWVTYSVGCSLGQGQGQGVSSARSTIDILVWIIPCCGEGCPFVL